MAGFIHVRVDLLFKLQSGTTGCVKCSLEDLLVEKVLEFHLKNFLTCLLLEFLMFCPVLIS